MQAFGLVVVELDGEKVQALAAQLTAEGYSVATASVSASDPQPVASAEEVAEPSAVVGAAADTADEPAATTEPDNGLPFKCPACGATYPAAGTCTNGHDPVATLPTADVLAGATVEDAAAAAGGTPAPDAAADESAVGGDPSAATAGAQPAPAPPSVEPAAEPGGAAPGTEPGPTWPTS